MSTYVTFSLRSQTIVWRISESFASDSRLSNAAMAVASSLSETNVRSLDGEYRRSTYDFESGDSGRMATTDARWASIEGAWRADSRR